jgi:hypothetical protein
MWLLLILNLSDIAGKSKGDDDVRKYILFILFYGNWYLLDYFLLANVNFYLTHLSCVQSE